MKKQDFKTLKEFLNKQGYKYYDQQWHNEDYILCKGFHKKDNKWEEDRSAYQIILSIYDYSLKPMYWDRLPDFYKDYIGIEVHIDVSRTVDERIDLILQWEDNTTIEEIEEKAESFYNWACKEYPRPKQILN